MSDFHGAKAALFIGTQLLVYLRDDKPGIPFPNHWDFPGGGREGSETPEETLFREINEEFGLDVGIDAIRWKRDFIKSDDAGQRVWFFVLMMPEETAQMIRFGEEGQRWTLMSWRAFAALPEAVPSFAPRLAIWQAEQPDAARPFVAM